MNNRPNNPLYYWDNIDEVFRHCDTDARIEGNPPIPVVKIKDNHPMVQLRGLLADVITEDKRVNVSHVLFHDPSKLTHKGKWAVENIHLEYIE